jgi:hypothetical protein
VTAATLGAWVGDNRQVGQQVTGLGHLQRDGIGKLGESRWDRGMIARQAPVSMAVTRVGSRMIPDIRACSLLSRSR